MPTLNYILLAVADPAASARFYTALLGREPVENSPTFVLYVLPNGIKLGLWIANEIVPAPQPAGGVEVTFSTSSDDDVRATHAAWQQHATILQQPTAMDFGFTFVAADPDGHRLRVFAPAA
ncbi:VOC family protein [Devosia sp. FKR38]|uniref:VOC family protein n=1 Tax=Devosia sp. FKR38 TaxID=2562312 RepID=UPI0010BF6959|nr:VOC family protein [Devosia sp. FKR38]